MAKAMKASGKKTEKQETAEIKQAQTEGKQPPAKAIEEEQFDWSGFLAPNSEKLYRFVLIAGLSIIIFSLFAYARQISFASISFVISGWKPLLFIVACYVFGCYTSARKISLLQTAAIILVPELLIAGYLFLRLHQ